MTQIAFVVAILITVTVANAAAALAQQPSGNAPQDAPGRDVDRPLIPKPVQVQPIILRYEPGWTLVLTEDRRAMWARELKEPMQR
jgi:hypothetical protein